jgi:4-amino-4-deoxy-L-arabinose transferase-like glycosyltransferase
MDATQSGKGMNQGSRRLLCLVLLIGLIQSLIMVAVIPPWQGPDEPRHFEYIRLLHDKGRLLTAGDTSPSLQREILDSMDRHDYWRFGYTQFPVDPRHPPQSFKEVYWPIDPYWMFQPPLYYVLAAAALVPVAHSSVDTQLYALRFISILPGLLTILVAYWLARELFPGDRQLIIGIPAFVALLPMQAFISATVSNDQLAELFASLFFLGVVQIYRRGWSFGRAALLLGALALGLLTKRTALVTVAILSVMLLDMALRRIRRTRHPRRLLIGSAVLMLAGLIGFTELNAAWVQWIMRYYLFLPSSAQLKTLGPLHSGSAAGLFGFFTRGLLESFWGRFGWLNVRLSAGWYLLMGGLSAAAFLGVGEWLLRSGEGAPHRSGWQRRVVTLFVIAVFLAIVLVVAREYRTWAHFAVTRPDMHIISIPQGRYLFPVMVPIATLFILGTREFLPRQWRVVGWVGGLSAVILLDVVSIVGYILPFYLGR